MLELAVRLIVEGPDFFVLHSYIDYESLSGKDSGRLASIVNLETLTAPPFGEAPLSFAAPHNNVRLDK